MKGLIINPYIVECRACGRKIVTDSRTGLIAKMKEHAEEHYKMKNLPSLLIEEMKSSANKTY